MRTYRISDRKEPRFRVSKFRYTVLNRELYDKFKQQNPNIKIDYITFKEIVITINQEIVNFVIDNKEGVFLPANMGRIHLGLYPPKERPSNAEVIQNEGIQATHFNFDSNGFVGKIIWLSGDTQYKTENTKFYGFIGHRDFKTRASQGFRNNPELYIRPATMIKAHEHYKRINNERNKINSQSSDQPSEDTE